MPGQQGDSLLGRGCALLARHAPTYMDCVLQRSDRFVDTAQMAMIISIAAQENFASAKAAAGPQTPHRDVMKAVAELWKQQKQSAQLA